MRNEHGHIHLLNTMLDRITIQQRRQRTPKASSPKFTLIRIPHPALPERIRFRLWLLPEPGTDERVHQLVGQAEGEVGLVGGQHPPHIPHQRVCVPASPGHRLRCLCIDRGPAEEHSTDPGGVD